MLVSLESDTYVDLRVQKEDYRTLSSISLLIFDMAIYHSERGQTVGTKMIIMVVPTGLEKHLR